MIWLHGLLLSLMGLAATIQWRTRHMSNEWILTGLCLSALWIRVQTSGGTMVWATGTPPVVIMALLEQWA